MKNELTDTFNVSYQNSVSTSHIVFSTESGNGFFKHQLKMISYNQKQLTNMLPFDYRKRDKAMDFHFDITSKISLTDYLINNVLSKKDVIHILSSVTNVLTECESYMLTADKFILNTDYIYIDPSNKKVLLIYIPIKKSFDGCEQLKKFIIELISVKAKILTEDNDNYTQRILECMKDETVTINEIRSMLDRLTFSPPDKSISKKDDESKEKNKKSKITSSKQKRKKKKLNTSKRIRTHKNKPAKEKNKFLSKISNNPAVYIQFLIILAFIAALIFIIKSGNDITTKTAGLVLTTGGLEYFVLKNKASSSFLSSDSTQKDKNRNNKANNEINIPVPKFKLIDKDKEENNEDEEKNKPDIKQIKNIVNYNNENEVTEVNEEVNINNKKNMNTVLLSSPNKSRPYLIREGDGKSGKMLITKSPFVIGRLKDQTDYAVDNPAVGKIHAEIILKENKVYIKDMNSKNGTFINDMKIKSNKTFPIEDKDRIMLANEEFSFKILEA